METVIHKWLDAMKGKDFVAAARFWFKTPGVLAAAVSEKFSRIAFSQTVEKPAIIPVYDDRKSCGIYQLKSARNCFFQVGVIEDRGETWLVSPQTIYRRRVSHGWHRWSAPGLRIVVEKKESLSASVKSRIIHALESIDRILGRRVDPEFLYYVPGRRTYAAFLRMENRVPASAKAGLRKRSWLDPFGGDVISRDPSDIHELVHGLANALAGWPPPILREGLAECFTTPHDWRQWIRLGSFPGPEQIFSTRPGSIPGWYTGAAVFTVMAQRHLGETGFIDFWNKIPDTADCEEAACLLRLPVETMIDDYHRLCEKSILLARSEIPGGLFLRLPDRARRAEGIGL